MRMNGTYLSETYPPEELLNLEDHELLRGTRHFLEEKSVHEKHMLYQEISNEDFLAKAGILVKGCITCKSCKSTDIDVEIKQTSSADEGSTAFLTCRVCRKRWKA